MYILASKEVDVFSSFGTKQKIKFSCNFYRKVRLLNAYFKTGHSLQFFLIAQILNVNCKIDY